MTLSYTVQFEKLVELRFRHTEATLVVHGGPTLY